jgi:hypothetical protein
MTRCNYVFFIISSFVKKYIYTDTYKFHVLTSIFHSEINFMLLNNNPEQEDKKDDQDEDDNDSTTSRSQTDEEDEVDAPSGFVLTKQAGPFPDTIIRDHIPLGDLTYTALKYGPSRPWIWGRATTFGGWRP